ncbi:omega-hydroxypalmitate O-feruloyl transferase [Ranunculus cassubicifolius]
MPAEPIPASTGDSLYLSILDDMIGARVFTSTVYFYRSANSKINNKPVAEVLRDTLAKVLVPYYPFSGSLGETKKGKLEVFFGPDQGTLLIEAHSEATIDGLGSLTIPNPAWARLIYRFPIGEAYKVVDMPSVIAQITSFSCADGIGAMQFIGAWAATARSGVLVTNPKPCWDREFFKPRKPPLVKFPRVEFMKIDDGSTLTSTLWKTKPVQECCRINHEFQTQLKQLALPDDGQGCTSFDALAAHVRRSWVKALNVNPLEYELRLTSSVNARQKFLDPPLKDGFYGNVVTCCSQLSSTARLVREARKNVTEDYVREEYVRQGRILRKSTCGGLWIILRWTDLKRLEFGGKFWMGRPVYAGPIDLTPTPQVCVILPDGEAAAPSHKISIVVCIFLSEAAASKFRERLLEFP